MIAVRDAIHARLVGDALLTAQLSTFEGQPAIFVAEGDVPGVAELRYVVIRPAHANEPFDTKTHFGREPELDIGCYDAETGSQDAVEAISERVFQLLHRHRLTVSGYGTLRARASGPIVAPTEDQIYGRIVTVSFTLMEA